MLFAGHNLLSGLVFSSFQNPRFFLKCYAPYGVVPDVSSCQAAFGQITREDRSVLYIARHYAGDAASIDVIGGYQVFTLPNNYQDPSCKYGL